MIGVSIDDLNLAAVKVRLSDTCGLGIKSSRQSPGTTEMLVESPSRQNGGALGLVPRLVFRPKLGDGARAGVVLHPTDVPAGLQRRANCHTGNEHSALGGNRRGPSDGSPDDCRHFPASPTAMRPAATTPGIATSLPVPASTPTPAPGTALTPYPRRGRPLFQFRFHR